MRGILLLAAIAILASGVAPSQATATSWISREFEVVGARDLNARGMNAGMAIAGDCGYVGSRSGAQGSLIVDLRNPVAPRVIGEIPHLPGSTPRELRAVTDLDLLVVLNYRLNPGSPNTLDLYSITDCRSPMLRARVDFGNAMPHEFFLWRDPSRRRQGRALAYVAMWGHSPSLRVIALSNPATPVEVAAWDAAGLSTSLRVSTPSPSRPMAGGPTSPTGTTA